MAYRDGFLRVANTYGAHIPADLAEFGRLGDTLFPATLNPVERPHGRHHTGQYFDFGRTSDGLRLRGLLGAYSSFWFETLSFAPILSGLFDCTANLVGFIAHESVPEELRQLLYPIVLAYTRVLETSLSHWHVLLAHAEFDRTLPGAAQALQTHLRQSATLSSPCVPPVVQSFVSSFREQITRAQAKQHAQTHARQKGSRSTSSPSTSGVRGRSGSSTAPSSSSAPSSSRDRRSAPPGAKPPPSSSA